MRFIPPEKLDFHRPIALPNLHTVYYKSPYQPGQLRKMGKEVLS
jgi:hypothetical protein